MRPIGPLFALRTHSVIGELENGCSSSFVFVEKIVVRR